MYNYDMHKCFFETPSYLKANRDSSYILNSLGILVSNHAGSCSS